MVSGGITSYSSQAVPHCPQVFSSTSLHCAHILLFFFLFHFSTTFLLLLVRLESLSIWGCLKYYVLFMHWYKAGIILDMACPAPD